MTFPRSLFVRFGLLAIFITTLFADAAFAGDPSEYLIYNFPNYISGFPRGNIVADSAGNLYGVSFFGGNFGWGTVYQLVRPVPPATRWEYNLLYSFGSSDASNGSGPVGVIFDAAGNLYGTTSSGAASNLGIVFELSPPAVAGSAWTETVLYNFKGGATDGDSPGNLQTVVFDKSGNLYGVTTSGGTPKSEDPRCPTNGCGVVYELTPPATAGAEWTETVIHYFNGTQGYSPVGTPIFDAKGNLYGAAAAGGRNDGGVIYKMIPPATTGGAWTYKTLYAFGSNPNDALGPETTLTLNGNGVLYGGAGPNQTDLGSIFQVVPPAVAGGAWTESVLYHFGAVANDGTYPNNVIFDKAGNLYGTTILGGDDTSWYCNAGCGTVFELSPSATAGAAWTETILHSFPSRGGDGTEPSGGLLFDENGRLLGVTTEGGDSEGTAFAIVLP
jgi:uncharacterized repeat protein (TIGR03803 family)